MASIHPTAIVSPKAELASDVVVGPYCVVGDHVTLHSNVELISHVCIAKNTEIGESTKVYPFAVLGFKPQDLKYAGEETRLVIGKNCEIREHTSLHLATKDNPTLTTSIGDNVLLMGSVHIAHDCKVGSNVIIANGTVLGGHVVVDDFVIIGGASALHQFTHVGTMAFIAGASAVTQDVLPYAMYTGGRDSGYINGPNIIGLRRKGFSTKDITLIKKAYAIIFNPSGSLAEKAALIEETLPQSEVLKPILEYISNRADSRILCTKTKVRGA